MNLNHTICSQFSQFNTRGMKRVCCLDSTLMDVGRVGCLLVTRQFTQLWVPRSLIGKYMLVVSKVGGIVTTLSHENPRACSRYLVTKTYGRTLW